MSEREAASAERRGLARLLWGILTRPRATMQYVSERGRRTWWLPALLTAVLVVLPLVVAAPITSREAMRSLDEQMPEEVRERFSEEQLEQMYSRAASPVFNTALPAVGSVAGHVIAWLVWAGLLYLGSVMLGGRSAFGQILPVVVWARLPHALRGLLQTIYILTTQQLITSPGLSGLVGDAAGDTLAGSVGVGRTLLTTFLGRIDLFVVWSLALLVVGVSVAARVSRRKSVLLTVGVWIVLTILILIPSLAGVLLARGFVAGP